MGVIVSINPTYGGFMYAETPKFGGVMSTKNHIEEKSREEYRIDI